MYKVFASFAVASFSYFTTISDGVYYLSAKNATLDLLVLGRIPLTDVRIEFEYILVLIVSTLSAITLRRLNLFGRHKLASQTLLPGTCEYFELISI